MTKYYIIFVFMVGVAFKSHAQKTYAQPADFAKIFERPLLVELLEENPKIIKHLEKQKKKHHDAVEEYREFIRLYNENIKMAVDKFWTLNKVIRYAYTKEIDSLSRTKYFHYACLYYSESPEQFVDYATGKSLIVPTLNYSRLENHKKVDYSIYLPVSFLRPHDEYIETDLVFGVQFIQRNIEYIIAQNKSITATQYAKQFGATCSHLETKILLLDSDLMNDTISMNEIKNRYKYQFAFTSPSKINQAVENASPEHAYIVSLPYEIPAAGGPGTSSQIVCTRLIIDALNGNILSSMGTSVRESNAKIFLTKDFAVCNTCN